MSFVAPGVTVSPAIRSGPAIALAKSDHADVAGIDGSPGRNVEPTSMEFPAWPARPNHDPVLARMKQHEHNRRVKAAQPVQPQRPASAAHARPGAPSVRPSARTSHLSLSQRLSAPSTSSRPASSVRPASAPGARRQLPSAGTSSSAAAAVAAHRTASQPLDPDMQDSLLARIESQVAALRTTLADSAAAGALTSNMAAALAKGEDDSIAEPADRLLAAAQAQGDRRLASRVRKLAAEHADNVRQLEALFMERLASEQRVAELHRRMADAGKRAADRAEAKDQEAAQSSAGSLHQRDMLDESHDQADAHSPDSKYDDPFAAIKAAKAATKAHTAELAWRARTRQGDSISKQRMLEELAEREAEEAAMASYRFKAKPVPRSTTLPMFTRVMAQAETRRKLTHEARRAELERSMQPFELLQQHEEEMAEAKRTRVREIELDTIRGTMPFQANPIPATTVLASRTSVAQAQAEEDAERRKRVAERAADTLAQAALPPRMEMWQKQQEAKRRQEDEAAALDMGAGKGKGKPKFRANPMPNFTSMQAAFDRKLAKSRKSASVTRPEEFNFTARHARRERARLQRLEEEAARADEQRMYESAHSCSSTPLRASQQAHMARKPWREPPTGPVPSMTKAAQLRAAVTQDRIRQHALEAQQAALEEEQRAAVAKAASMQVAPLVQALERARLPTPLAWQIEDDTPAAKERRAAWRQQAATRAAANAKRVADAQARRPPLLLRASVAAVASSGDQARLAQTVSSLQAAATEAGLPHAERAVQAALASEQSPGRHSQPWSSTAGGGGTWDDDVLIEEDETLR